MAKKLMALLLAAVLTFTCAGCASTKEEQAVKLTIAYQGGIGYAPVHIMEAKKLIEENYGKAITVEFVKLDSGAAINEGIIGGTIDIGCMGLAPAISGVVAGIPYKVVSNLCAQSHGLMTNDPDIKSLKDITYEDKIALINTGSIQHLLLAMTAEKVLGDAHALDNNIQAMSHAEGMASLESGTVALHLTSSPFIYQERADERYHELKELSEVWPGGNSFLVAMASTKLSENKELFDAIVKSFDEAISFINENREETASIETEYLGLDADTVNSYLDEKDSLFFGDLKGAQTMADFMFRAGFMEKELVFSDFKFDNVSGD